MRKTYGKLNSSSKKGITLVELVVAITMTAIFAVACVALINPIERMYQSTVKLTKAQLLADTVVDAIRKECDDVKHDDKTTVWIANLNEGADDDTQLLSTGPSDTLKKDKGNTLVFQRNLNYTEAIYSCVPISATNRENVKDPANPIAGNKTGHSVAALFAADSSNQNKGIVHFGYYQSKEDDRGVFPIRSYDYTNPVTASTYGNFTVKLEFSNLTLKDGKYPAYVNCVVSVYDGLYTDASVSLKGPVYSRSTVISFSANGSGKGSGGGYTPSPSTLKNVYVTVNWKDSNNAQGLRPADGVKIILISKDGSVDPKSKVLTNVTGGNRQTFMFANVDSSKEYTIRQYKVTSNVPIDGYTTSATKDASGFVITNTISTRPDVWLIRGSEFNKLLPKDVRGIVFTSEAGASSYNLSAMTAHKVALPRGSQSDAVGDRLEDYMLYVDSTNKMVYVVSQNGEFIAHSDCSQMFYNLKSLESITWNDGDRIVVDTSLTTNMVKMFMNCERVTQFILPGFVKSACTDTQNMFENCKRISTIDMTDWNTQNVTDMNRMFYNVTTEGTSDVLFDFSSFSFGKTKRISKLFYNDTGKNMHISEIRFPTGPLNSNGYKEMLELTTMDAIFSKGKGIKKITNFNNMYCPKLTDARNMFNECNSLTELDLHGIVMPLVKNKASEPANDKTNFIINMFKSCASLNSVNLNGWDCSGLETLEGVFTNVKGVLKTVSLNDCTVKHNVSLKNMFNGCSVLTEVHMESFNWNQCANLQSVFENCKVLNTLDTDFSHSKLKFCTSTARMFKNCYVLSGSLDFSKATLEICTDTEEMFSNCKAITSINLADFAALNTKSFKGFLQACENLTSLTLDLTNTTFNACTDTSDMFNGCKKLASINLTGFNAPNTTSCARMFKDCQLITTIDLAALNTLNVTTMEGMFDNCYNLQGFDSTIWNNWNTSNVTSMATMFHNCCCDTSKVQTAGQYTINISNFDFSNVEYFTEMFNCDSKDGKDKAHTIILPMGDNAEVKAASVTTYRMFRNRKRLTNIENLNQFSIRNTHSDSGSTFANTGLAVIDIRSLDLSKITTNVDYMFNDNTLLTRIYVNPETDTTFAERFAEKVIFNGCSKNLVGPNGFRWENNDAHKVGALARIDTEGGSGYFWPAPTT